jgi:hypothetical protein
MFRSAVGGPAPGLLDLAFIRHQTSTGRAVRREVLQPPRRLRTLQDGPTGSSRPRSKPTKEPRKPSTGPRLTGPAPRTPDGAPKFPLSPDILSGRIKALAADGRIDDAVASMKTAPSDAQNVPAWNTLIWECMRARKYQLAYKIYVDVRVISASAPAPADSHRR